MNTILFDISGVLLDGKVAIPGAIDAVNRATDADFNVRLVTNTSRRTRHQIWLDLFESGFDVQEDQIYTAPLAARGIARQKRLKTWCLVHPNLLADLDPVEPENANAVIVGDAAEGFTYERLNTAFQLCLDGAMLIAIGRNKYFYQQGDYYLDAGPFVEAIEYAIDRNAIVAGKPSLEFFQQVLTEMKVAPEQAWMIGDDVYGDIQGALSAGIRACLVKTGKYREGDGGKLHHDFMVQPDVSSAVDAILAVN